MASTRVWEGIIPALATLVDWPLVTRHTLGHPFHLAPLGLAPFFV